MTRRSPESTPANPPRSRSLRVEMIVGSLLLAFGLFALPGLVFWAGGELLGPYGKDAGMGTFYGDFYAGLASGAARTWMLALGPLVAIGLIRLLFLRRHDPRSHDNVAAPPPARSMADPRRVEPRVSLD